MNVCQSMSNEVEKLAHNIHIHILIRTYYVKIKIAPLIAHEISVANQRLIRI